MEQKQITINAENADVLQAIDELLTACKERNEADGYTPDWTKPLQKKYVPGFIMERKSGRFVYQNSVSRFNTPGLLPIAFGSQDSSAAFAQKYADTFNKMLGGKTETETVAKTEETAATEEKTE